MIGRALSMVALCGAALAAARLARPDACPSHRPVALALCGAAALNIARPLLALCGAPLALDRALYLAFPALAAWLALEVLAHRWRSIPALRAAVVAAWLVAAVAVVVIDAPRGSPGFASAAAAVQLAAVAVQLGAGAAFVVDAVRARRIPVPDAAQTVVFLLLAGDVAERFGPWMYGRPARDWDLARWQWSVVYLTIWYLQARRLRWARTIRAAGWGSGSSRSGRPSP